MSTPQKTRTDWFDPRNIVGLLGFLGMLFGFYVGFQRDTPGERINKIEYRLDTTEKADSRRDDRLDGDERAHGDILLRLDRLERKR